MLHVTVSNSFSCTAIGQQFWKNVTFSQSFHFFIVNLCFTHIPTYHCSRCAQTTSRNAYTISRYGVPASAGPLLPL